MRIKEADINVNKNVNNKNISIKSVIKGLTKKCNAIRAEVAFS